MVDGERSGGCVGVCRSRVWFCGWFICAARGGGFGVWLGVMGWGAWGGWVCFLPTRRRPQSAHPQMRAPHTASASEDADSAVTNAPVTDAADVRSAVLRSDWFLSLIHI